MPNTINITINVSDGDATPVIQQVVAQLREIGPAGEAAGAQAGAGLDKVGEHALTSLDNVRLLRDDLGIRLPRSIEKAISQSAMLSGAIGAIGPGLLAMGAVEIFAHIGESVYKTYEEFVELKGQITATDAVIKSFGDAAEGAMNRAYDATEKYIRLTQGGKAADIYGLNRTETTAIKLPEYQTDDFKKLTDEIKGDFEKITGETVMPKDLPNTIEKLKAYNAEQEKSISHMSQANAALNAGAVAVPDTPAGGYTSQQLTMQQEQIKVGKSLLSTLIADQAAYDALVKAEQAQIGQDKPGTEQQQQQQQKAIEAEKSKMAAIGALDKQAMEAQLSGEALIDAERKKAEADFVAAHGASTQAMADIDAIYDKKLMDLWDKEAKEAKDKNAKIAEAQNTFNKEMDSADMRSDDAQVEGYARIADNAAKATQKIQDDWLKLAATADISATAVLDGQMRAASVTLDVQENMLREMQQLHSKTMEQIAKEEEQTARYSLPAWQQAQLKIVDAFQDRVREVTEAEKQQETALNTSMQSDSKNALFYQQAEVMAAQDADAKILAARQAMNAQIQQSDEETRDKLASGLQSLFSHPEKFFEDTAMKTGFQLMANEMLSVFQSSGPTGGMLQYLFGMGPQMSTSTNLLTAIQSALGQGNHNGGGINGSQPGSTPGNPFFTGFGDSSANPATMQFTQGSTQILTGAQTFVQGVAQFSSAVGSMSMGGGGFSGGGGLLGGGGNTLGFPGASNTGGDIGSSSGASASGTTASYPQLLGAGQGSYTTAAGNGMVDASSLGPAGAGFSDSNAAGAPGAGMGAAMGIAGGALMGGMSIYSAYQNSNPIAGLAGGAMGGMEAGAALGSIIPGLGTVVGGAIGAIAGGLTGLFAGIFGDQGKGQAEGLDVNTIQPELTKDMQDYEAGRSGYSAVAADLTNMLVSAKSSTTQMGSGARNYFSSNIQPEINAALMSLQKQEQGGRSAVTMSAAQYHTGGMIGDFGDMATSDTEGFIHARRNEFVVNPMAASAHMPILQAMNSGTSFGAVQPRMPASSSSGGGGTINIQAIDSKSVATWAKAGGGKMLMAALNQANSQYSGTARG